MLRDEIREKAFAKDALRREAIRIDALGGVELVLTEIHGPDRDRLETEWEALSNTRRQALAIRLAARDASGASVFDDDDIDAIAAWSPRVLRRLSDAIARISRVSEEDVEAATGES